MTPDPIPNVQDRFEDLVREVQLSIKRGMLAHGHTWQAMVNEEGLES